MPLCLFDRLLLPLSLKASLPTTSPLYAGSTSRRAGSGSLTIETALARSLWVTLLLYQREQAAPLSLTAMPFGSMIRTGLEHRQTFTLRRLALPLLQQSA